MVVQRYGGANTPFVTDENGRCAARVMLSIGVRAD